MSEHRSYLWLARLKYGSDIDSPALAVGRDTDIVIEAFPRSANTFAVMAFKHAQTREVRIAHHLHSFAQVAVAAKMRIPILLLIRDPEQSVVSYAVFHPAASLADGLRYYARFYRAVLPYRSRFVLARFETVVNDFGLVIRKLNEAFGTRFRGFRHAAADVREVLRLVEQSEARWSGSLSEERVPRPSESRDRLKSAFLAEFWSNELELLRSRAFGVYKKLAAGADV